MARTMPGSRFTLLDRQTGEGGGRVIYGIVKAKIERGTFAFVKAGTLEVWPVDRTNSEKASMVATVDLLEGEEVLLVPQLDHRLLQQGFGQQVAR
jgi:hypothetical protein